MLGKLPTRVTEKIARFAHFLYNGLDSEEGKIFLGQKIRAEVLEKTKLTASGGIAANKLLAKICSDVNKPDGLTYLANSVKEITNFLHK